MGLYKGTGGAKVFFNGIEAYTSLDSYGQINAVIPYQVGAKADVVVQYGGLESDGFPVSVTDSAPSAAWRRPSTRTCRGSCTQESSR
jgi:uncharacterized protein (TIGR03437 family)